MSKSQILFGGHPDSSLILLPGVCQPCGKGVLVVQACSWSTSSSLWSSLCYLWRTNQAVEAIINPEKSCTLWKVNYWLTVFLELYFRLGLIRVPNKVLSISPVVRCSSGSSLLLIHSKFFLIILEMSLEDLAVEAKPNPDWSSTFWSNQVPSQQVINLKSLLVVINCHLALLVGANFLW